LWGKLTKVGDTNVQDTYLFARIEKVTFTLFRMRVHPSAEIILSRSPGHGLFWVASKAKAANKQYCIGWGLSELISIGGSGAKAIQALHYVQCYYTAPELDRE
jgi:hypothetical protein